MHITLLVCALTTLLRRDLIEIATDDRRYTATSAPQACPLTHHALKDRVQHSSPLTARRKHISDLVRLSYWAAYFSHPVLAVFTVRSVEAAALIAFCFLNRL
jgi:hypothetical protein